MRRTLIYVFVIVFSIYFFVFVIVFCCFLYFLFIFAFRVLIGSVCMLNTYVTYVYIVQF